MSVCVYDFACVSLVCVFVRFNARNLIAYCEIIGERERKREREGERERERNRQTERNKRQLTYNIRFTDEGSP